MAKKPIITVKDLDRAIRKAPPALLRRCVRRIALEAFEGDDGKLDANKELGSDFISEVVLHLECAGLKPTED